MFEMVIEPVAVSPIFIAEAEKIDTSDPAAARAALRVIQERWEEIGKVPREEIRPLEARLRAVEERREPSNNARDNLNSLALCFAACASAQRGEPMTPGAVRRLPN